MTESNGGRLGLLAGQLPESFDARVVAVGPGRACLYDATEWNDAVVVVARGTIELELLDGGRCRFVCGSVLSLSGLPVRALRNRGRSPAVLVAVSRTGRA